MKKTIAITSALAAASSLATAEIKINEFLSFAGFVDASYSHTDLDVDGGGKESDNSFGIDQVEIDWMFNFGKVTAQVDLQYENGANGDDDATEVEQAFVNYDLGNSLTITTGRYESTLGLEAKEPTGLYQYSTAYAAFGDDLNTLPQYAQGVKLTKDVDGNVYSLSIQDEAYDYDADRLGGSGDSGYGIEASASIALSDATTLFLGGAYGETDDDGDGYSINAHVTHVSGPWTVGAEVVYTETNDFGINDLVVDGADIDEAIEDIEDALGVDIQSIDSYDQEVLQAMIMANYAYSDCCSVTGRISYVNAEVSAAGTVDSVADSINGDAVEFLKYTLAHNYAVTDNLAVITEISYVDAETFEAINSDELVGAVEVLFTF